MDNLDQKILHEICENARDSRNSLAKRIRCSREVLNYRIKKLEQQGIITGYQARINIPNFVYGSYVMCVQSYRLDRKKEIKILSGIKNLANTLYIEKIGGDYDFIIGFTATHLRELHEYMCAINDIFGEYKFQITLLTMIQEIKDSFKGLFTKESEHNSTVSQPELKMRIDVDKEDLIILHDLSNDCNLTSWQLAKKCGISELTIRHKIKRLMAKNIILGFRTMINEMNLDYQSYDIFIKTNLKSSQLETDFKNYLQSDNKISYAVRLIGEYDYLIRIHVKNNAEIKDYILDIKEKFMEMILKISSVPVFDMIYHTSFFKSR